MVKFIRKGYCADKELDSETDCMPETEYKVQKAISCLKHDFKSNDLSGEISTLNSGLTLGDGMTQTISHYQNRNAWGDVLRSRKAV